MLSLCSGMEQIRAEGGNPRTGCSHRTRPLRYATNYTHCGTSTLLACSRDSECTYPRRPCICTRSGRRASACAQTAVSQSVLPSTAAGRHSGVFRAARCASYAVHAGCSLPRWRCRRVTRSPLSGDHVATQHTTLRHSAMRHVATWHNMLRRGTTCCNITQHVATHAAQCNMLQHSTICQNLVSPPSQSLR